MPSHNPAEYRNMIDKRGGRRPSGSSEMIIGRYYYGIECPICMETSPIVERLNDNLVGAWIHAIAVNPKVEYKGERIDKDIVKKSWSKGGIEATPTMIWDDGVKDVGGPESRDPDSDSPLNLDELAEYWCRRAARCFIRKKEPNMSKEHINQLIQNVFDGPPARNRTTGERDPYGALRYVCTEF